MLEISIKGNGDGIIKGFDKNNSCINCNHFYVCGDRKNLDSKILELFKLMFHCSSTWHIREYTNFLRLGELLNKGTLFGELNNVLLKSVATLCQSYDGKKKKAL